MEDRLLRALFKASSCNNSEIIPRLLNAIANVFPVKMCSFWKFNSLSNTVSIYAREKHSPLNDQHFEYVHPIQGSLIGLILEQCKNEGRKHLTLRDVQDVPYIDLHKAPERVHSLGLRQLVSIPIPQYQESYIDGILNIYPDEGVSLSDANIGLLRDYMSLTLSRARLIAREELTRDISAEYEKRAAKDLASVLHPIIQRVLRKYLGYEGCSIFILDPFKNTLNLAQSTGILGRPLKQDVFYSLGEGLTGMVAANRERLIIEDVKNTEMLSVFPNYEHKFSEDTKHPGESFMAVPIMSPSHPSELLGVIRFTNRLNPLSDVVDRFSEEDFQLISHAMNLVALYMDYEQGETRRTAFAMQMAHEMLTPATAIRASAQRLQRKAFTEFHPSKVADYLRSILDHAELQIALNKSIEYVWAGRQGTSKASRYQVSAVRLEADILTKAKKLVIPIARDADLQFSKIMICGDFPILYVDKYAFEQVFFNLLTNAIKYRVGSDPETFRIEITCSDLGRHQVPLNRDECNGHSDPMSQQLRHGYLLHVSDYGMGISRDEAAKIFNLGYRRKGIEKTNVRGLGIGLAVVDKILSDFGGNVWVSGFYKPTVFSIFLPDILLSSRYLRTESWLAAG